MENYEKKYKEALEKFRKDLGRHELVGVNRAYLESIFPELAESEDEKIRKWIIENIQETLDVDGFFEGQKTMAKNAIAWLEKQGKNNMGISEATKQKLEDNLNKALEKETSESFNEFLDEQKSADDIERKYNPYYNMSFEEAQKYISNRGFDIPWTDCDVFVDFRYVTQTIANILCWADNNPKQKSAWSEEDERIYQSIMDDTVQENQLCDEQTNWLRDIKYRYFPQPNKGWTPMDEQRVKNLLAIIEGHGYPGEVTWLNSLKDRCTWKPSDEQVVALENILKYFQMLNAFGETIDRLKELEEQLKKLKE